VAWLQGALGGQDAVQAEVQLMERVIAVMVGRVGTLVAVQVRERGEGEECVLVIKPQSEDHWEHEFGAERDDYVY
jgi:hypothetical protein